MFLVKVTKMTNNRVKKLIFPTNCFGTVMRPANLNERTRSLSRFMLVFFVCHYICLGYDSAVGLYRSSTSGDFFSHFAKLYPDVTSHPETQRIKFPLRQAKTRLFEGTCSVETCSFLKGSKFEERILVLN